MPETWLINSPAREVNYYVDITETFDRKVPAVRAHVSQIKDPDALGDRPGELRLGASGGVAVGDKLGA